MYQFNPLIEAVFVSKPSGRIFHRGQMKQASFSLKQTRRFKESLEKQVIHIRQTIQDLEKKLVGASALRVKDLQNHIRSLRVKKQSLLKLIKTQENIIANHRTKIQRMALTNKNAGASMI